MLQISDLYSFCEKAYYVEDHPGCLLNAFQRGEFHFAVEIQTAGENVRARQALE